MIKTKHVDHVLRKCFCSLRFSVNCKENELQKINTRLGALEEKPTPHRILDISKI